MVPVAAVMLIPEQYWLAPNAFFTMAGHISSLARMGQQEVQKNIHVYTKQKIGADTYLFDIKWYKG